MFNKRAGAIGLLFLIVLASAPVAAQATEPPLRLDAPEALALHARARDATELYAVSGCLLGMGAAAGAYAALFYTNGDVVSIDGWLALLSMPATLGLGITLLGAAAGIDGGVTRWSGARRARGREGPVSGAALTGEQRDVSHVIMALYVSGIASLVGALIPGIIVYRVQDDAFRAGYTHRIDYGLFVPEAIVGGAGYLMLLAAIGMDITAGAWSGAASAPSVSIAPLPGGAALSVAGAL